MSNKNVENQSKSNILIDQKQSLLSKCCPCLVPSFLKAPRIDEQPYISNTQDTHSHLPIQQNSRKSSFQFSQLPPTLQKQTFEKKNDKIKVYSAKSQQSDLKQSVVKIDTFEDYENLQNEYDQYLKTTKKQKNTIKIYPVDKFNQNKLSVFGNHRGRLLGKIYSVYLYPSEIALIKQRQSAKTKQKLNDPEIDRYWEKRYFLFQKFDEGIRLDKQSWFSITPEAIAEHLSAALVGIDTVLDGFCGAGGDSIKFAAICKTVFSNDIDETKIKCLVHNAAIYGVDNIKPFACNFFNLNLKKGEIGAVYLAPPWGGPDYHKLPTISPQDFTPSLVDIIKKSVQLSDNIFMLLPANTDIDKLAATICQAYREYNIFISSCSLKIQKIYFRDSLKFIAIYFGPNIQKQIKLNQQLDYIYRLLNDSDQKYFKHKRIIRKIRQQYGMINLLNYIFQSQKINDKVNKSLMKSFLSNLVSKGFITYEKIRKLDQIDEKQHEQQCSYKSKTIKKKQKVNQKDKREEQSIKINQSCDTSQYREATISYVSEISVSKIKDMEIKESSNSLYDNHKQDIKIQKTTRETTEKVKNSQITNSFEGK